MTTTSFIERRLYQNIHTQEMIGESSFETTLSQAYSRLRQAYNETKNKIISVICNIKIGKTDWTQKASSIENSIEKTNKLKKLNAPVILILQAADDHNSSFVLSFTEINALQNSHFIIFKVVSNLNDISIAITNATEAANKRNGSKISTLIIRAHGHTNAICLKDSEHGLVDENKLSVDLFQNLDPNAKILIHSCSAGQSFAPTIARIADSRSVEGFTEPVFGSRVSYKYCKTHGIHLDYSQPTLVYRSNPQDACSDQCHRQSTDEIHQNRTSTIQIIIKILTVFLKISNIFPTFSKN